jgi:adenylosuccinate synthase|tara:strand:+ start:585 stop:1793 length:1209 start_codon:yes stop_codon:yes gene_type:complete
MANLVVVGTQWGDEGKGKFVDILSEQADTIVRFQGGHNAGHTIKISNQTYKLSLLPSGIIRSDKTAIIGNGVVLDPWKLLDEIRLVESMGIKIGDRLMIADNIPLILQYHRELDQDREEQAGTNKIGTTGRGIGPAYEDKVGRRAIRTGDLKDLDHLRARLKIALQHHNKLRNYPVQEDWLFEQISDIANDIVPYIGPVWEHMHELMSENKQILFEGAQGSMLDVDWGTYPYVTSSNTLAGMASIGTGVPHNKIPNVLGITKAYTTRVGEGPMETELFDEVGEHLATVGKEKGTVTGRGRRCGWFDAPLVKKTCMLNGVTGIALTKIDVLDELGTIKIYNGEGYEEHKGWMTSTYGITDHELLPKEAKNYIKRIEELVGVPVIQISTGPDRDETITLQDPFK